jgi:hypothetical protein
MRQSSAFAWCAVAIALLAAIAVALTRHAAPNFPVSDLAVTETYTILASQGRLLVGPYSRFSWHHPGPIYFYLVAPFYKALGSRTIGLEVGALAINLGAMAAAMLIAFRAGGRRYLIATSAALLFFALRFQPVLTSIWNPHVIAVPAIALVTSAVGCVAGYPAALLWVSALSSFVVQTHVSTAPVALSLAALAVAGTVAWRDAAASDPRRTRLTLTAAALVAAVFWLPAIVEQVRGPEHNLSALWRYFASSRATRGWLPAAAAWAFGLSGAFRTDYGMPIGTPVAVPHASLTLLAVCAGLAGLVVAGIRCWLAGRRGGATAMLIPAGVCAIALWSLHRVPGSIDDHVIFWLSGIGVLGVAACLLARCRLNLTTNHRGEWLEAALPAVVIVAAAIPALGRLADGAGARAADNTQRSVAARELSAAIETYLDSSHAKPLIKVDQDAWEVTAGVVVQLQRTGRPFAIEPEWLDMFTKALGPDGSETVSLTIAGPDLTRVLGAVAGARVIRASAPFSAVVAPLR